ncbi:MAG TPA: hypothetical protein VF288_10775 [Mycobacteriales bacterium]
MPSTEAAKAVVALMTAIAHADAEAVSVARSMAPDSDLVEVLAECVVASWRITSSCTGVPLDTYLERAGLVVA